MKKLFLITLISLSLLTAEASFAADSLVTGPGESGYTGIFVCDGAAKVIVEVNGQKYAQNQDGSRGKPICNFTMIVTQIQFFLNWAFIIVMPIVLIVFMWAGLKMMSSNPSSRTEAKKMLLNVVIGFIVMCTAFAIVKLITSTLTGGDTFNFLLN
ncbi:MAG: pilin [Candidatus Taylorbacteria bacterium]|nr:pilin [Candidatus Taylorbacteria bacterium]